jgi:hypothetical protein
MGAAEAHVAFRLRKGIETFDAVAFGVDAARPLPEADSEVDFVGTLEHDTFAGMPRLRLRVVDYASTATSPLQARRLAARPLARAG